jgi:hypothetical protein
MLICPLTAQENQRKAQG